MAQSADVDFTLDDIERISHTVPCICKASPSGEWEISDVHRAGGITGILGELDRAGKLHRDVHSIDYKTLEDKLNDWDIMRDTCTEEAKQMYLAAPGHIVSPDPWTHTTLFDSLDRDRVNGAIHDIGSSGRHRRAVWPCCVATSPLTVRGEDRRCAEGDLDLPWTGTGRRIPGTGHRGHPQRHSEARYGAGHPLRGPEGRPWHAGDAVPTSFVKGKGIGKQVAMLTDGRYSGGSSGLAIGHIAPEAANKGPIA